MIQDRDPGDETTYQGDRSDPFVRVLARAEELSAARATQYLDAAEASAREAARLGDAPCAPAPRALSEFDRITHLLAGTGSVSQRALERLRAAQKGLA